MSSNDEQNCAKKKTESVQAQKLFIKNLNAKMSIQINQLKLVEYFSNFGNIIDVKVLKNRELIRKSGKVCLSCFSRRRDIGGNSEQNSCYIKSTG